MEKSIFPFLHDLELSRQGNDQNFGLPSYIGGLGANTGDVFSFSNPAVRAIECLRKLRLLKDAILSGPIIGVDKEKYQISLDVKHFDLENISVKTGDGYLVVEARHEEKPDNHGSVSRHFLRRILLPDSCNMNAVESRLSSDGVLTVIVPLLHPATNERLVPITRTGPMKKELRVNVKTDGGDVAPGKTESNNAEPADAEPDDSEPADSAEAVKNGNGGAAGE